MLKNIFYSALWNKCPKCHNTKVFTSPFFKLRYFSEMNQSCACCGEKYEKEPGYFYGAMYVSYALMVGWFVLTWAADSFIFHVETWQYLTFLITTMVFMSPVIFRVSRLVWLNFFISYDESKSKCTPSLTKTN